ncbi:MAG: hypothetical protein NT062_11535 [Proteobacteria bacterium]|nr:hypothetical protein [Pseudomonadota bacterium]
MSNSTKTETKTESTSSSTATGAAAPAAAFSAFAPFQDMWTDAVERMQQVAHAQQNLASMWVEAAGVTDQLVRAQQQMMSMWTDAASHGERLANQYAVVEKDLVARTQSTMAGWSQMAQDAVAYGAQLSTEGRKFGADTAKKMTAR